mmetsp:Transcript_74833/g.243010  ORF Transcript_74833/g.243010 Transcript_74833/m.243010 type:complete len:130 (-) Transcript_74833:608-997(-)
MSGVLNSDSFFRDSEVAPETALATATAFATADSAPAAGRAVDTTMTAGAAPAAEATEAATASRGRGIKVGAAAGAPAGDADEPHGLPPGDVGGCQPTNGTDKTGAACAANSGRGCRILDGGTWVRHSKS